MNNHQPTTIIILGGGGDLAQRKLLPALFNLYIQENLPSTFQILGLARTTRTHDEYRALVKKAIEQQHKKIDILKLDQFCSHIFYIAGSFDSEKSYTTISDYIDTFEHAKHVQTNRLFYLAVPPAHYKNIFYNLHRSELTKDNPGNTQWARVLVEKPFGNNYSSALELDTALRSFFSERQIFRIDHYLAKEAVLNILSFRFANTLLHSPWNKDYIEEVRITMHETITAESRGAFYDDIGALRDVGQNHLLQILALVAMEEPADFTAEYIRVKRAELLEKLIPLHAENIDSSVVRGQYIGYTNTPGVEPQSSTETYFEFKAFLDTEMWRDVPFYVRAGKALEHEQVVVEIIFRDVSAEPFQSQEKTTVGNKIILTVSPVQSMNITLNVKKPGHGFNLETNTLSYTWDEESEKGFTAYEKVLLDCISGDQTLFTTTEEVLASWKFITSITEHWQNTPLQMYQQGSGGPEYSLLKK